jgi:dTDP-4-amino-4,6-dideoxygalactose transaminase
MASQVPLCKPEVGEDEIAAIREVFAEGSLSHGPKVGAFEAAFARKIGVAHAIAANSWTSASFLVCQYIRETLGPGDVIIPSFTFVASANTVVGGGLTPVFADVDWATGEVTAETLAAAMTPRTRAIMVVHYATCLSSRTAPSAWARRSAAGRPARSPPASSRSTPPRTSPPAKAAW